MRCEPLSRFAPLAALAAAMSLVATPVAVAGFSLTSASAPTASVALDGTDQTASYTIDLTVDNSGLGATIAGWHLTITSTPLSTAGPTPHTLPADASSITAVASVCAVGPCTPPANSTSYPVAVPAGSPAPAPATLFSTPALTGIGTFTVTPTVAIAVPANAYAGTYTSTLTLALATGP